MGMPNLPISSAIHQTEIEIDEEGSKSATGTAVIATRSFDPPPPTPEFHCTRSFVFTINDRVTSEILFFGVFRGY